MTSTEIRKGFHPGMPGSEPFHRNGCPGFERFEGSAGCEQRYGGSGEFPACWSDDDIADHEAKFASLVKYFDPAVTAKVRELSDRFRPMLRGQSYGIPDAQIGDGKIYLKVMYRKPECRKLAAAVEIDNIGQAMKVARRFADLVALPLRVQVIGSPEWDAVHADPFSLWTDVSPSGVAAWIDYSEEV